MLRIEEISDKAFTEPLSIDSALLEPSAHTCYGSRGFKAGITGAVSTNATPLQVRDFHFSEIQRSGVIKKNIHEIDFGDYHDNLQGDIIASVKRIHAATQKDHSFTRQELAHKLAGNIRGKVNMLVRGGLLRPALSPVVSFGVSKAVNHFQNLHNERVEAIKRGPIGVAAGDVNPEYEREFN